MSFTDAVFDGESRLAGITARRIDDLSSLDSVLAEHEVVPLSIADLPALLSVVRPDVLIDARMRRREQPEAQRGLAPLTIGLGPGFVAGEITDLRVETGFGDDFGRVYERGATRPQSGGPPPILGYGRERFIYAPTAGRFRTTLRIGDTVSAGQPVASIDELPLQAPLDSALRGLTRDGVSVTVGTRVIEVDPRGAIEAPAGIGSRQARLGGVLLEAITQRTPPGRTGVSDSCVAGQ
jgi:xanthine dehydrogenase accessory factor